MVNKFKDVVPYDFQTEETPLPFCDVCKIAVPHTHLGSQMPDGTEIKRSLCLVCFWRFRDHYTAVQEFQMGICQETKCRYCVGVLAGGGYVREFVN